MTLIVIAVVIGALARCMSNGDDSKPPASAPKSDASAAIDQNDAEALDKHFGTGAFIACGAESDDYLRKVSKYAFKWDDIGFLEQKFDKYRTHVASPGVLTMVSNKVMMQNDFGAYQRMELLCRYDTQTKRVLGYSVETP